MLLTTRYNATQVTTGSDAANTVQQIEATLSPQQMQQFQQLQKQQGGRRLQQGPKTQQAITTIGELNQGASLRLARASFQLLTRRPRSRRRQAVPVRRVAPDAARQRRDREQRRCDGEAD